MDRQVVKSRIQFNRGWEKTLQFLKDSEIRPECFLSSQPICNSEFRSLTGLVIGIHHDSGGNMWIASQQCTQGLDGDIVVINVCETFPLITKIDWPVVPQKSGHLLGGDTLVRTACVSSHNFIKLSLRSGSEVVDDEIFEHRIDILASNETYAIRCLPLVLTGTYRVRVSLCEDVLMQELCFMETDLKIEGHA